MGVLKFLRNNTLGLVDEQGQYWVKPLRRSREHVTVFREPSLMVDPSKLSFGSYIDFLARQRRGDSNQQLPTPSFGGKWGKLTDLIEIPRAFGRDDMFGGVEGPEKYTLSQGIALDEEVFKAFSNEFHVKERRDGYDGNFYMIMNTEQVQAFQPVRGHD